jgi:telomere length regulation protein
MNVNNRILKNNPVCSNAERLIELCLLEKDGVFQIAREFSVSSESEDNISLKLKQDISRVAQLVTSIPDKAQSGVTTSLSSHLFFKKITAQILAGLEECDRSLCDGDTFNTSEIHGTVIFAGEIFVRICRRGSADVLLSELLRQIHNHVKSFLIANTDLPVSEEFESKPGLKFWLRIIEAMKDPYAIEKMSEQLLHQLQTQNATDVEAYWILRILFHQSYHRQSSIRAMFVEKFLLWKVFPVRCLRWILHFAVLEYPPNSIPGIKDKKSNSISETVQRLLVVWSKREYVQSAPIEQQAYLTASIGILLEKMSKKDLDATKDGMRSILQGVSCRLEYPSHLIRKMASTIALVFSKVIDPKNPLYLDNDCNEDIIDWEFGIANPGITGKDKNDVEECSTPVAVEEHKDIAVSKTRSNVKGRKKKVSEILLLDPDEVVDPDEDDDDDASENSSDSSLQPYDLEDDDTDLKRNFSHLVDVVGALRKTDDADGVEKALDIAEKLVRASPDELRFVAGDLIRTLVQVRCSDSIIEEEEESAEAKRQKALVALVATCPLESVNALSKLLYSPNVDMSQRIMILDVMTDGAQELANTRTTTKTKNPPRPLISTVSDTQPWFMPSSVGPTGAGIWKEIPGTLAPLNLSYAYEREIPSKPGQIKKGKTRRWSVRPEKGVENQAEWSHDNKFPQYAAAFMLPAMQGFDKKSQGVDFLGRDFIVLGKLIYMLGACMKCAVHHPEASVLSLPLLDMLSSREICHHAEAYVRKSVLFAASCILVALHPSYIASALLEGNPELSKGLEWIRTWALHVAESDPDKECYTLAMTCLQLHSEMALQATRAIESGENVQEQRGVRMPTNLSKVTNKITIPFSNVSIF